MDGDGVGGKERIDEPGMIVQWKKGGSKCVYG